MRSCLPAVKSIVAVALILHGSFHLLMPYYWNGTSPLLDGLMSGSALSALVDALLVVIVAGYAVAGLGLFNAPVLRKAWKPSAVIASIASLSLFGIMLNATSGIDCWYAGLVTSIATLIVVPIIYWKGRRLNELMESAVPAGEAR